jgi:hypothetical protein
MSWLEGVAVHPFAGEFTVASVEVEPVFAGDQSQCFGDVAPEFLGGAGSPGVAAGDGEATVVGVIAVLEALDIVPLPAMERDGEGGELLEGALAIDADGGIALSSKVVSLRRERFLAGGT